MQRFLKSILLVLLKKSISWRFDEIINSYSLRPNTYDFLLNQIKLDKTQINTAYNQMDSYDYIYPAFNTDYLTRLLSKK